MSERVSDEYLDNCITGKAIIIIPTHFALDLRDARRERDEARESIAVNYARWSEAAERANLVVDALTAERAKVAKLRAALEQLACLGNGERPGNSDGNRIAQRVLAETEEGESHE